MELDDAEEAEVVPATVADLVDAITARDAGPDAQGRPTFTTTSPNWWVGGRDLRRHGGGPGAERRHADRPAGTRGAFAARLLPPPDQPGVADDPRRRQRPRRALVQHPAGDERGGGQGDLPHDVLVPRPRRRRRATSSRWRPDVPPPAEIEGFEAPFPFDIRELGATERREDGTYQSTRRCWFRTTGAAARRPGGPRLRPGLLLGHDRGVVPPAQPRRLGHAHRRQPRSRRCGSTGPGGPTRGASSTSMRW